MKKSVVFLLLVCLVLTSFSAAFAKETFSPGMELKITKEGKDFFSLTDVGRHVASGMKEGYLMDHIECYGTPVLTALKDALEVRVVYSDDEELAIDFGNAMEYILPDDFMNDLDNTYLIIDDDENKVVAMDVEPGDKYTFTKPGRYGVWALYDVETFDDLMFEFTLLEGANPYTKQEVEENNLHVDSLKAIPTSSPLSMNKTMTLFEAYNINGNNYFKLRDIAKFFLSEHSVYMFNVGWDAGNNAISITTGARYEFVGGEMEEGDGYSKPAQESTAKVYVNGKAVNMKAYNINGNNFFKLRDLADAIGFYVEWNAFGGYIEVDVESPEFFDDVLNDDSIGKTIVYDESMGKAGGVYHKDAKCPRIANEVFECTLRDAVNGSIRCQVCGK